MPTKKKIKKDLKESKIKTKYKGPIKVVWKVIIFRKFIPE